MSGIKVTKDQTAGMLAAIKALTKDRVLVGIPSEKAFRAPDADDPHPELNNAEIGFLMEFGAPDANIPARPHLVPGVQASTKDAIPKLYREAADKALAGDMKAVDDAHVKVGFTATSSVKNLIRSGIAPPLAEATIADRKRRGRMGTTPLLDTGQYVRNLDFVVKPAGQVKGK